MPPETEAPENQQPNANENEFNLSLDDFSEAPESTDAAPQDAPAASTETVEPTANAEATPAAQQDPTATDTASTSPVDSFIDQLTKETPATEATTTDEASPEDTEKALNQAKARLAHFEDVIQKADPMVCENGTKLNPWMVGDKSLYECSKETLNQVLNDLINQGNIAQANDVQRDYDRYFENKQLIERSRETLKGQKEYVSQVEDGLAWAKAAKEWENRLKAKGVELTKEQKAQVDAVIQQRNEAEPASKHLPKDQQIFEALQKSGISKIIAEKLSAANPAPKPGPDANAGSRRVQSATTLPDGYDYSESQVKAMTDAEFAKNEAAIDKAMATGRLYKDLTR